MKKSITVQGITFNTVQAAADHFGQDYHTINNRLKYGWSVEQAFGLEWRPIQNGSAVKVDGVVYDSIKSAAKEYEIPATTVRSRLSKGFTIRQALGIDAIEFKKPVYNPEWQVTVAGIQYATLSEAARQRGKSYKTVVARLAKSWTIDEAFDVTSRTPKHGYPGVIYKIENILEHKCYVGVTMRTIEERWQQHIRDAFGSPEKNRAGGIREAIVTHGSSAFTISIIAHAVDDVEMQTLEVKYIKDLNTIKPNGYNLNVGGSGSMTSIKHAITLNGKKFDSISAAMRHYNITLPYQTIIERFSNGWTPEQAFDFKPHETDTSNWGAKQREITINEITYRSLAEACRQIPGAPDPRLAQNRLGNGWTPEEAFNLAPHADQRGRHSAPRNVLDDKPTSRSTTGYKGVSRHQQSGKWQAAFSHKGRRIFVGTFDDPEMANEALQKARSNA